VGLYYDPMLAKLIVHAPTRETAIERMHRSLLELTIEGVDSSRDFQLRVMEDSEFRSGAIEIQWLERRLESLTHARPPAELTRKAAIVAALIADRDRRAAARPTNASSGPPSQDAWTRVARMENLR
jgi:acetyl-CoA carboxylase biotin carboxylase subunit